VTTVTMLDDARVDAAAELTREEVYRYSRHLILPDVGVRGQRRLRDARVLLVGAGGLGSPLALYLAAAGVGHLGVVDDDVVDVTNLQRQILHGTASVGRPKLASAVERLHDLNPLVTVEPHQTRLTAANALRIIADYDIVADGTDNFATRYLVNDACVLLGRPNVYGSIFRFDGQASVFATPDGPCYRCLYPEPPPPGLVPSCAEGGVLGVLPGLVGTIQATEVIKLIIGIGDPLIGRLLLIDAAQMSFRTLAVRRDPACPACGTRELRTLVDYEALCGLTDPTQVPELSPRALAAKRAAGEDFDLIDVREPHEYEIARIDGARLVPLATLPAFAAHLDRDREIVVHCKAGTRSARAARLLREAGFQRVWNLTGGIAGWSADVDPAVPRY
jgi:sulfur-carrier protein adenylyltransferase/sulfurtransferase